MRYLKKHMVAKMLIIVLSVTAVVILPAAMTYADEVTPLPDPGEPGGF